MKSLEEVLLAYVREHRTVMIGDLVCAGRAAGCTVDGNYDIPIGDDILWSGISPEFAAALHNLAHTGAIRLVPTTQLDYLVCSPFFPMGGQQPIPCRVEAVDA